MGQQTIHSLAIGSIYALLAVGLNFMSVAHRALYLVYGGLYALGGYITWWVVRSQRPIWVAFGGAVLLSALLGLLSYWSMRLRAPHGSEMSRLLGGLGLLICLAEISRLGISSYRMKVIAIDGHQVAHIGPLMVTDIHWLVFGSTFALFTAVQGFLTTSRSGRALRAFLEAPSHGKARRQAGGSIAPVGLWTRSDSGRHGWGPRRVISERCLSCYGYCHDP